MSLPTACLLLLTGMTRSSAKARGWKIYALFSEMPRPPLHGIRTAGDPSSIGAQERRAPRRGHAQRSVPQRLARNKPQWRFRRKRLAADPIDDRGNTGRSVGFQLARAYGGRPRD